MNNIVHIILEISLSVIIYLWFPIYTSPFWYSLCDNQRRFACLMMVLTGSNIRVSSLIDNNALSLSYVSEVLQHSWCLLEGYRNDALWACVAWKWLYCLPTQCYAIAVLADVMVSLSVCHTLVLYQNV